MTDDIIWVSTIQASTDVHVCDHAPEMDKKFLAELEILSCKFVLCPQCYKSVFNNIKKGMGSVGVSEKVPTAIIRCTNCHRRHGGEIADTSLITWRCKGCKWHNAGRVKGGNFSLLYCSRDEVRLKGVDVVNGVAQM